MQSYQLAPLLFTAVLSLLLPACGGGGSSSGPASVGPTEEPPVEPEEPPVEPEEPPLKSPGLLKPADSDEELAAAIREGMVQNQVASGPPSLDFSPAPPAAESDLAGTLQDFSTTNLQESGVDEADRVKYDGEILYVADSVQSEPEQDDADVQPLSSFLPPDPRPYSPVISMYRTDPASATVEEAGRIELTENDGTPDLYVRETNDSKQLLGVSGSYSSPHWGAFADYGYWQSQLTQVRAWDVSDPMSPAAQFSLDIEGALLASRRIGDTLYVVTRFAPVVEGLLPYPASDTDLSSNEAVLQSTEASDLLPEFSRDGMPNEFLVSGTDCYVPNSDYEGPESLASSGTITTITAIDLAAPQSISSACLNGYTSGFYVSTQSVYLTTNAADDKTLIHKIALNEGQPQYRGSGGISGHLGTSNPSFMMSESGDDLRVVSSLWDEQIFPLPVMPEADALEEQAPVEENYGRHHLTILRESNTSYSLERIARLPNKERQSPIGKPGENIFAVRFLGNRAYVVTFRTIDPLYVLDLSSPDDPRIAGELEIPGFSTLLQPLTDGLLLGVGNDVLIENPTILGIKIALFDVSDTENPIELDSEIVGKRGSHSPALRDHHALTLLKTDNEYRLALPIQRHSTHSPGTIEGAPWAYYDWSDSALYEFSVDIAAGSLSPVGKIVAQQRSDEVMYPTVYLDRSRAIIHDDAVFFQLKGQDGFLSGPWGQ